MDWSKWTKNSNSHGFLYLASILFVRLFSGYTLLVSSYSREVIITRSANDQISLFNLQCWFNLWFIIKENLLTFELEFVELSLLWNFAHYIKWSCTICIIYSYLYFVTSLGLLVNTATENTRVPTLKWRTWPNKYTLSMHMQISFNFDIIIYNCKNLKQIQLINVIYNSCFWKAFCFVCWFDVLFNDVSFHDMTSGRYHN